MRARIPSQIMQGLEAKGPIVKALFRAGFAANQNAMRRGGRAKLWDMLLFKKLQSALGGRLKIVLTGACCACPACYGCIHVHVSRNERDLNFKYCCTQPWNHDSMHPTLAALHTCLCKLCVEVHPHVCVLKCILNHGRVPHVCGYPSTLVNRHALFLSYNYINILILTPHTQGLHPCLASSTISSKSQSTYPSCRYAFSSSIYAYCRVTHVSTRTMFVTCVFFIPPVMHV